jgi:ATP-dependent helicase HrpB
VSRLPIYEIEASLMRALGRGQPVVLTAPTGSGKSTQVPQMLLDHGALGDGRVLVLQPRRLAARMLAAHVARERGGAVGDEVGYQIRLENRSGPRTRILYLTEGILLRRLVSDPTLHDVSAILFDEFHERHLYGDLTLARARQLRAARRPDLHLVVMSATLDAGPLATYLAPCERIDSAGRTFPVDIRYLEPGWAPPPSRTPVWDLAAAAFEAGPAREPDGHTLVFMPGAYEIRRTVDALRATPGARGLDVMPLHGELPATEQDAAVAPSSRRKIIVATNIAETSLTIDGVRHVIDAGLARIPDFDPRRGINTLHIRKISRAAADQRAGRAGRTAPGTCIRLWPEREHRERPLQETPEIHRLDLAEALLILRCSGIEDLRTFPWLDPPAPESLARADSLLRDLGALEPNTGRVTDLGRRMQAFPLHPRYARMLLAGAEFGCTYEAALIAALTQGRDLLVRQPGKDAEDRLRDALGDPRHSDLALRLRAYSEAARYRFHTEPCRQAGIHAQTAREASRSLESILRIARSELLPVNDIPAPDEAVQRCVLVGFIDQLARRLDGGTLRCDVVHRRRGTLDTDSVVRDAPLFVASEIREIQDSRGEVTVRLGLATAVEESWLQALFPQDFAEDTLVAFDEAGKRVVAETQRRFRDLVLVRKAGGSPSPDAAAELLAAAVVDGRLPLKQWTDAVDQWILRLNCLHQWMPELQLPSLTAEDRRFLITQICHGCYSAKEIRDRPVWPVLKAWIHPGQQALLDRFVPERLDLPGGRRAKIRYQADGPPQIAARIQDLYDVTGSLTIAQGRVRVVIQILGPNHRPVQVTENLAGFWTDTYPQLKKEFRRRYPRHEWR